MHSSPQVASLANVLGALAQLITDRVRSAVAESYDAGPSYAAGLLSILHFEGESIDHLCRALAISHSGAVRLVDLLESDGLVRRERAGRTAALFLTPRGRRAARRIEGTRISTIVGLLEGLTAQERAAVEPVLRALLNELTETYDDLLQTCRLCSIDACQGGGERCPVAAAIDANGTRQH